MAKKITKALSVRVIVIRSDHELLWRDSYKGVGGASILPKSKLHRIIVIASPASIVNISSHENLKWIDSLVKI